MSLWRSGLKIDPSHQLTLVTSLLQITCEKKVLRSRRFKKIVSKMETIIQHFIFTLIVVLVRTSSARNIIDENEK